MICTGVIDDSARLPSTIDRWTRARRSAGSLVGGELDHHRADLPPSADAIWDCLALRPTGTMATSDVSGSASSSSR